MIQKGHQLGFNKATSTKAKERKKGKDIQLDDDFLDGVLLKRNKTQDN